MRHVTATIYCETCQTLQDAVICNDWLAEPPVMVESRCEKRKRHRVRSWTKKQPCARCGKALLEPDAEGILEMWD